MKRLSQGLAAGGCRRPCPEDGRASGDRPGLALRPGRIL